MAETAAGEPVLDVRRSSIEKKPIAVVRPSPFERLPDEIIEEILRLTDPGSFASLILLNAKWRSVSQQAHLYAHQLSQCPSYAASHKGRPVAAKEDSLPRLRRLFAREVKRNLFEAYLRPSVTVIKLVSNSISSSSCPGGEGMQFQPSPKGHHLLAYNSSRIYVIDMHASEISVKRELKILRRPAATCIMDDGSILAVLLTEMQVDIYDLRQTPPRRTQSLILDNSPRAIALSPCGSVLAAAYEGGIEVSSLNPGALATERRAVKCDAVDALAFSFDGTQILGTSVSSGQPNTVILTAPYYDPGSHMESDNISALWTTSILFPNTSRDCSHAVLLQDSGFEEASWAFTYDRSFETFRAVRIDDLRNGTTYFPGPMPAPDSTGRLLPCTLPAASYHGDLVAAGFQGKDVWIYGVPEDLDAVPDTSGSAAAEGGSLSAANGLNRRNSGPSVRAASRMQEQQQHAQSDARVPQWQILCDNLRNTFIGGCKIAELDGANTVKWVTGFGDAFLKERLVVAARGIMPPKLVTEEDGIDFVDGGRITLIDFDYGTVDGQTSEVTIEVGTRQPEVLEEEHRDMDTEVAIVRRRTVAQRRGGNRGGSIMRAATTVSRAPPLPQQSRQAQPTRRGSGGGGGGEDDDDDDPLVPRRIGAPPIPRRTEPVAAAGVPATPTDEGDSQSVIEEQEALDAPYSHASPRSGTTLRRAATAAAINRRLHPAQPVAGNVQYRRADGRREHPHESDADNWVPPPPPYQKEDTVDLPAFMRHNVAPITVNPTSDLDAPSSSRPASQPAAALTQRPQAQHQRLQQPQRAQTVMVPPVPPVPPLPPISQTSHIPPVPPLPQLPHSQPQGATQQQPASQPFASHQRAVSDITSLVSPSSDISPPATSNPAVRVVDDEDDLYDVSPPESPHLAPARDPSPLRQPSGSSSSAGLPLPTTPPSISAPVAAAPTALVAAATAATAATPAVAPVADVDGGDSSPSAPVSGSSQAATVTAPARMVTPPPAPATTGAECTTTPPSSERPAPPTLDIEIPSSNIPPPAVWTASAQSSASPEVKMLSNAHTWPRVPGHNGPPPAALIPGHPQSAPPTNFSASEAIALSYPPAPRPDQMDSLHRHNAQPPPAAHRLSGSYQQLHQLQQHPQHPQHPQQYQQYQQPQQFQVPRVPVGSRDPARRVSSLPLQQRPSSSQQSPPHQQRHQPQYSQSPQQYSPSRNPLPQNPVAMPSPVLHQPRPQRPPEISTATPPPDTPLIISTPRGITGAFDPPGLSDPSGSGRAETPIVAPVPRHPRAAPGSAGSLMRPTVERLETIYSTASSSSQTHQPQAVGVGGGPGNPVMYPPQAIPPVPGQPPMMMPGNMVPPPIPNAPAPSPLTFAALRGHTASINLARRQSRAERSAAKNMADAKRKGWRRVKSRRGRGRRDDDAASTAAWTDITTASTMPAAMMGHPGSYQLPGRSGLSQTQLRPESRAGGPKEKDRKCIVM